MGAGVNNNRGLFSVQPDESGQDGDVKIASLLSRSRPGTVITVEVNGEVVVLSSEMKKLLQAGAGMLAEGKQVTLAALDSELSTTKAAELLGISREYLRRLCEAGEVPFRLVGSHRRLAMRDVLAYRERRQAERERKFGEMVKSAAEAGEYDLDITLEEASF
mgnify:CR=1 FL=1